MQDGPYPDVPPDFGHWLAGFIDGEGCFSIFHCTDRPGRWKPRFQVSLRADDHPILKEANMRTGLGTARIQKGPLQPRNPHPMAVWAVTSKADVVRLVELLDRYKLRAKKARDYAIWREAVWCYRRGQTGIIKDLYVQLRQIRSFGGAEMPQVPTIAQPPKLFE